MTAQPSAPAALRGSVTTGTSRCGIPLYTPSSTTFGSIMRKRTSSGVLLYSMLMIMELMQTDLPEPVVPAISRWGIFARSATVTSPAISRPSATVRRLLAVWNALLAISSRIFTVEVFRFGTSTPTAAFPGIGASMRTPVAARFMAMSSERFVILLILTPGAG